MPKFLWSQSRRRFIDKATGRAVRSDTLRRWINETVDGASARTERLAELLNARRIDGRAFQMAMSSEIRLGQGAMAAAAYGGLPAMTTSLWERVGRAVGKQLGYFMRFATELISGKVTPAETVNRAGMYQEALYASYTNHTVLRESDNGRQFVRRVLDPGASHCMDCPELAGVYPIDQVPPIGASECGSRCRCEIVFEDGAVESGATAAA
jgi:hypothetical protein